MTIALLIWMYAVFTTWLLFTFRIGMRHDASIEDFPERGEESQS